jgi:cytochrome oxidase assembly protein ShyY1
MKDEIIWLCKFLNVPYCNNNTLTLWQISRRNCKIKQIGRVNYNIHASGEQLSLFDFDIQEAI